MPILYSKWFALPFGVSIGLYFVYEHLAGPLRAVVAPIDAFAFALMLGAAISAVMEYFRMHNHLLFVPTAVWMAAISFALALGEVSTGLGLEGPAAGDAGPVQGTLTAVLAVLTTLFGVLSVVAVVLAKTPLHADADAGRVISPR